MSETTTDVVVAVLIVAGASTTFEAVEWAHAPGGHIQARGRWRGRDELLWRSWPASRVEIRATKVGDE